ncbi:hypothetical protein [Paenibacillus xylanexedens]|uniref:hypothetical protein n=1 Tax=Paenibacillus xylanexedens TaxID=528191 RepID=UPI00119F8EDB|nr:hypothetical protein [Paenibacillus xylanexedens]
MMQMQFGADCTHQMEKRYVFLSLKMYNFQDAGTWTIRMRDAMSTTKNQDEIDIRVKDVEPVE